MRRVVMGAALVSLLALNACAAGPTCPVGAPARSAAKPGAPSPEGAPLQLATGGTAPDQPGGEGTTSPSERDRPLATTGSREPRVGAATATTRLLPGSGEQRVALWVDVPRVAAEVRAPIATLIVVDTSGSMQGTKIVQARRAAARVVRELDEGDFVGIVRFDSGVSEVAPLTRLSARTRPALEAAAAELTADGETNLWGGVAEGENAILRAPATHTVRRVILISDGRATAGPTSAEQLGQLAAVGLARGVQITALGVGLDYDESTLNALAQRSSGRMVHLEDAARLEELVGREVALLEETLATEARLELVPAPGVTLVGVEGTEGSWVGGGGFSVPLGSLHAGQTRELAARVRLSEGLRLGERALLSVRLHYGDPADGGVARVQEALARVTLTEDAESVAASAHERAQTILATVEAAELATSAVAAANRGDLDAAAGDLARAEQRLRQQADASRDQAERERLERRATVVARARKSVASAAAAPAAARPRAARGSALEANDSAMDLNGY